MMAPETSCCEENESLKISGNITRLLLDMSEGLNYTLPDMTTEPDLSPWVKKEEENELPPSRKKRIRRKKPISSTSSSGFFFRDETSEETESESRCYPTSYMNRYISHKIRPVHEKPGKIPPLQHSYRLSLSRELTQRPPQPQQSGDKTIMTTQAPTLLDKSSLAWSGNIEQLPRLKEKKVDSGNLQEPTPGIPGSNQEVVLLWKPSKEYYSNHNPRDISPTNKSPELPRDHELYGKLLPCVRNCRVTWNRQSQIRTPNLETASLPSREAQSSPLAYPQRADFLARSSSASSHNSAVVRTEFKGKLQNYLHRSSDSCFKKLPCGLVYGKSLKGGRYRRTSRNASVELCVRPV